MPVTDHFERRLTDSLHVDRAKRQRRDILTPEGNFINPDGLLESIRLHGVLSPLLVTRSGEVIFGERRWTAAKFAGQADVPVRYVEDLSALELKAIELEENLRRLELPWRDEVRAVADLHATYKALAPPERDWGIAQTAQALQLATSRVSEFLRVAEAFEDPREAPRIARATHMREAYNLLSRADDRASAEVLEEISHGTAALFGPASAGNGSGASTVAGGDANAPTGTPRAAPGTPPDPPPEDILCADFITWAQSYSGPRFNLIHCDFPYGIDAFSGPQMHKGERNTHGGIYADDANTYARLIEALCANLDRLMSHSAHLMFWLSADIDILAATKAKFAQLAPDLAFWPKALIWHKTDNAGVLADPKRGPRHTYETALIASRGDRPLVRATSDAYGAPTDRKWHPSAKPEPVLRQFLGMFVDEHTRMLDPTCGGGSSLRAAESLGAESVLGLEVSPEHAKSALTALRQFRAQRSDAARELARQAPAS